MVDKNVRDATKELFSHLYDKNGKLIEAKVLDELADYYNVMSNASEVYEAITGGALSKPNYTSGAVLQAHEVALDGMIREAVSAALDRFSSGESLTALRREFHPE